MNGSIETIIYVKVKQRDGTVLYHADVAPGEEFTFAGKDKNGTMGTEILVWSGWGDVRIHTSCSRPIGPGLVFGKFTVVSGRSLEGGVLCTPADVNDDGQVNGIDVGGFTHALVNGAVPGTVAFCAADLDGDGVLEIADDLPLFVTCLLAAGCP